MKPILTYTGGKQRELKYIRQYIPDFEGRYIEPFVGGGALFFDLAHKNSVINDINTNLIRFYRDFSENFDAVMQELSEIDKKHVKIPDEAFYYYMRSVYNNDAHSDYRFATVYYYLNKMAFQGVVRTNSKGKMNVPYGRYKSIGLENLSAGHAELLKSAHILNVSYKGMLQDTTERDFCFLDPPYDSVFTNYGNGKEFTREDQLELFDVFKNLKCKTLMVIGRTDFIEKVYSGYIIADYPKRYNINSKNRVSNNSRHMIVTNYR